MGRTATKFGDRISSWSDLSDLIDHFSYFNGHDWLFRGVTDARHELKPKIGREKTRKLKSKRNVKNRIRFPYCHEDERAVFAMFQQQARAYLGSPPNGLLEWLAIAQHFGLPTRLLDWTDSLLVAAWFAAEGGGVEKESTSAIWVTTGVPSVIPDPLDNPFDIQAPTVYRPPHISPRISAQGSVLMICPNPTDEVELPFAKKIEIDRRAEFTIKKRLSACGINRRYLFPDLSGLTEHLTWMYKNDWLAGYRSRSGSEPMAVADDSLDEAVE